MKRQADAGVSGDGWYSGFCILFKGNCMKRDRIDYKIDLISGKGRKIEKEKTVRLLYLVDGSCTVHLPAGETRLERADILAVNSDESVYLESEEDILAAQITVNYYVLCDLLDKTSVRFFVDSSADSGRRYTELKTYMQNFLLAYAGNTDTSGIQERGYFYLLLQTLVSQFMVSGQSLSEQEGMDPVVIRMIHYIHANYMLELSLQSISKQLFISPSWASKRFMKDTGEHFVSYVKRIRMEHASNDLKRTKNTITQIAIDNGFSTPSVFNREFRASFNMTPKEYRSRYGKHPETKEVRFQERDKLRQILEENQSLSVADLENQQVIHADIENMHVWKKGRSEILNVGPAYDLASASLQKQVLFLIGRLDISYLRIWNVFSPRLMVLGASPGQYNFTFLDEIMDFCVDNKVKLFLDLAQRKDVAMASEKQMIYGQEADILFKSESMWIDVLQSFLEHIRHRYGEKIVGEWIFELSFFLNDKPYFAAERYSSRAVWDKGYEMIKSIIPSASVAGPGLIATFDQEYMRLTIEHFLSARHQPDIFTSIHFPYLYEPGNIEASVYQEQYRKVVSHHFLKEQLEDIRKILSENGFSGQHWITDWGNSVANRNYIQDSCYRASDILDNVLSIPDHIGTAGIFYASDIINAYADSTAVLSGSAGLISRSGICKPAYYAYRFLNYLGKYLIAQTEDCIITAENKRDIRIICYNHKVLGPRYYLKEENTYQPDELDDLFLDLEPKCLEIVLHLPDEDTYTIHQRVLNKDTGSVLEKWTAFGCSSNLSRGDLEYLQRTSIPENTAEWMSPLDGCLRLSIKMKPHEIRLITITKDNL